MDEGWRRAMWGAHAARGNRTATKMMKPLSDASHRYVPRRQAATFFPSPPPSPGCWPGDELVLKRRTRRTSIIVRNVLKKKWTKRRAKVSERAHLFLPVRIIGIDKTNSTHCELQSFLRPVSRAQRTGYPFGCLVTVAPDAARWPGARMTALKWTRGWHRICKMATGPSL